jgi:hypothetical protein
VEEADVWDSPEAAMEEDTNINMEDINCQYAEHSNIDNNHFPIVFKIYCTVHIYVN